MVDWSISDGLSPYLDTINSMQDQVMKIAEGTAPEQIWLVEHPSLYTAGTSANSDDLVDPNRLPVFKTGRGGQYTYHGPGQRVAYLMLNVGTRGHDVRHFVRQLENWVIATLAEFNVIGVIRPDRVGVWVVRHDLPLDPNGQPREDKIAAIGIRLRKWISFHGVSINVDPDLEQYAGIIPCGIREHGVTSLVDLGLPVAMNDLDLALKRNFDRVFGDNPSSVIA